MSKGPVEEAVYRSRTFLEPDGQALAAVASSVDVTTHENGRRFLDVGMTIIDNDGNKAWIGFWNWGSGADVDDLVILRTLRDEVDKLITAVEQAMED